MYGANNQASGLAWETRSRASSKRHRFGNDKYGANNQASGLGVGNEVEAARQASSACAGNNVFVPIIRRAARAPATTSPRYDDMAIGTGAGNNVRASDTIAIGTNANAQQGGIVGENAFAGAR